MFSLSINFAILELDWQNIYILRITAFICYVTFPFLFLKTAASVGASDSFPLETSISCTYVYGVARTAGNGQANTDETCSAPTTFVWLLGTPDRYESGDAQDLPHDKFHSGPCRLCSWNEERNDPLRLYYVVLSDPNLLCDYRGGLTSRDTGTNRDGPLQ